MISVGVNPPTTPVTEGSLDVAPAMMPNVCKMPGPPAPFVPTPLPNLGRSADRLSDATSTVKIEGNKVAIKGSFYMSQPSADVASQGTGGGLVSSTVQGKTEFVAPGSMNVKAEGKNIQLLGDSMTNNGGSPANSSCLKNQQTPSGLLQWQKDYLCAIFCECLQQWREKNAAGLGAAEADIARIEEPGFTPERQPGRFERQGCVEEELRQGNHPSFIPEQRYDMSQSPPVPGEGGWGRIPDVVVRAAGNLPAAGANLTAVVEMKFPGDRWQRGQQRDYNRIAKENNPAAPVVKLTAKSCKCRGGKRAGP
jgi:uncharacterized Zn-binding protein involved in type VI secretion